MAEDIDGPVSWEIRGQVGPHKRTGADARGWLWEIGDEAETRRVFVEITGTALAVDAGTLPRDTLDAIRSEGESEVKKILDADDPPRLIQCGTDGCRVGDSGDG